MKINDSIEHLFRHEYGKIVSALTGRFSSYQIDLIEDSVQEALLKAMSLWSYNDIPENPSAWLYRVAHNHLIDNLRRAKKTIEFDLPDEFFVEESSINESSILSGISDEQLKMIFACCHPSLNITEQIILSLKLLAGLSIKEIASALLKKEEAVKKAITRAKEKFKTEVGEIEIPRQNDLTPRLKSVIKIIYLLFNEGYKSTEGEALVKKDVCLEAVRLAEILIKNRSCDTPQLNALLSLMYFNSARFDARINSEGELITLENQNRNLWDKNFIEAGIYYLNKSSGGTDVSEYHIEAGIASLYTTAKTFEETDWDAILSLYDILIKMNPSPIILLNRLVVFEKLYGPLKALQEMESLENEKSMTENHLYYSIKADFKINAGSNDEAVILLKKAISLSNNKVEKKFLQNKLTSCLN